MAKKPESKPKEPPKHEKPATGKAEDKKKGGKK